MEAMTFQQGLLLISAVMFVYGMFMLFKHDFRIFEFVWILWASYLTLPWLFRDYIFPLWVCILYWVPTLYLVGMMIWIAYQNYLIRKEERKADCRYIVILGCKLPSRAFTVRENKAYEYLMMHPETIAVCSGAQGLDEEKSEAQGFFDNLVSRGISPERMMLEDKSYSTKQNLENTYELLNHTEERVGIVTARYHVYRSLLLAKKIGFKNPAGISAKSIPYYQPDYLLREVIALTVAKLKGYI